MKDLMEQQLFWFDKSRFLLGTENCEGKLKKHKRLQIETPWDILKSSWSLMYSRSQQSKYLHLKNAF